MTTKISPRDWEALSAYLDGQLSSKERTRLEESLRTRTDLRAALEELRRTHTVLRSQAVIRAPRNFTLTEKMIGSQRAKPVFRPFFPTLRLATVLATALFILVAAGDFLTGGMEPAVLQLASKSVPINQTMLAAPEAAAPQPKEAGEYPVPTQAPEATPAQKFGGGVTLPTETPPALELPAGAQPYPSPATALRSSQLITGTLSAYPYPEPTVVSQADQLATHADQTQPAAPGAGWVAWRILELFFGLVALGAGGLAYYLWRTGRG